MNTVKRQLATTPAQMEPLRQNCDGTMKRLISALSLLVAASSPVLAHPHVFVSVVSEVLFGSDGKISGVRHHWKFDDMYSAFVTANLGENGKDPTPEQMLPIAKTNAESLKEFDFFTYGKMNGKTEKFKDAIDYSMSYDGKDQTVTLHFTLPLETPAVNNKLFVFQVYDPSYFVAFELEKKDPVKLVDAPKGCSISASRPSALSAADQKRLADAAGTNDSPGDDIGMKLSDRTIVACP